jgi:hypothetical protein
MKMFNHEDNLRLAEIKALIRDGRSHLITDADKQWVIDTLARANSPVPAVVKVNATKQGFNTSKLKTR